MIFEPFNQANEHKEKYIITARYFFSLQSIRMSGKSIHFDGKKHRKKWLLRKKKIIIFNIDDTDVNKILVSKKEPYGTKKGLKYFIGYNDNDVIRPLYLRLSQMTGYTTKFVKNNITTMSLRVKDTKLLKN